MSKKQIIEWVSRIVWLIGVLFLVAMSICLIIAISKTEMNNAPMEVYRFESGKTYVYYPSEVVMINTFPVKLWRSVAYDGICTAICFVIAKVLHYISVKGE